MSENSFHGFITTNQPRHENAIIKSNTNDSY